MPVPVDAVTTNCRRSTVPALCQLLANLLDVAPVVAVLAQAPRHGTPELVLPDDLVKLLGDELGRVPRPEELVGPIEVVLASRGLVRGALYQRRLPRPRDVGTRATRAEGELAPGAAVLGRRAAVAILGAAARRAPCALVRAARAVGAGRDVGADGCQSLGFRPARWGCQGRRSR